MLRGRIGRDLGHTWVALWRQPFPMSAENAGKRTRCHAALGVGQLPDPSNKEDAAAQSLPCVCDRMTNQEPHWRSCSTAHVNYTNSSSCFTGARLVRGLRRGGTCHRLLVSRLQGGPTCVALLREELQASPVASSPLSLQSAAQAKKRHRPRSADRQEGTYITGEEPEGCWQGFPHVLCRGSTNGAPR